MYLCVTCGTQFAGSDQPARCAICEDERQYVGLDGQHWTTLEELRLAHYNKIIDLEPGLTAILTEPKFGIGQRALFVQSTHGNVLWDCISLLDTQTFEFIRDRGGIKLIAISHPHYYTTMAEWSRAFGDAPVLLHELDREWVMRPDDPIRFWKGDRILLHDGITLIRGGGHFPGGALLHWPAGAGGKGALLSGDIIQVVPDRRWVSFMFSYPNYIPLNATAVRRLVDCVEPFAFECIYGAFDSMQVTADGKGAIRRSADRYIRMMTA